MKTESSLWSALSIVAAAVGGLLIIMLAHSSETKHSGAADEVVVAAIAISLERTMSDVGYTQQAVAELKEEIQALRVTQSESTETILNAIGDNH